jgi:predicted esterase
LIHARRASAEDILCLTEELDHPDFAYIAPEAAGNTWYPYSFLMPIAQNRPWLGSALSFLRKVFARAKAAGIPGDKIALVGFSQGACLATEFVAWNAAGYGGLVGFSGALIGPPRARIAHSGNLSGTPCFFCTAAPDPHVPWERDSETASVLNVLGGDVPLRRYPNLPHTNNQDEIEHAKQLLSRLVSEEPSG